MDLTCKEKPFDTETEELEIEEDHAEQEVKPAFKVETSQADTTGVSEIKVFSGSGIKYFQEMKG